MTRHALRPLLAVLVATLPGASFALDQWASKVVKFSTQYGTTNWSAAQTLKAPDTTSYGDIGTAWTTSTPDAGPEYVTLRYTTPVYATGAMVRETYGYGFVVGIDAIEPDGTSHTVWSGPDNGVPGTINQLEAKWPRTSYLVDTLKVRINTALHAGYEEIDAVQLSGVPHLDGTLAPRLTHKATLTCTNTTTAQKVTKTLTGPGTSDAVAEWDCEDAGLAVKDGDGVTINIKGTANSGK